MSTKTQKVIAIVISHVLDPFVTIGMASIIGVFLSGLNADLIMPYLLVILFGTFVPLVLLRYFAVKNKKIDDWDIKKRKQRFLPLAVLLIFLLVHVVIARFFINEFLINFTMLLIVWVAGILFITLFWKISGHTGAAMLAAGLFIRWFGWGWWLIFLIVPLVSWARVVRKDHSVYQVVAGILYSGVILFFSR